MPLPTKIFVGNLSSETTSEDVRPLFEQYGRVVECDVLRNYGFVHMAIEEEAEQAISELAGTTIHGQRINVEKSTGTSRGGGRGGGKMGRGGRGRGAPRGRGGRGASSGRGGLKDDPYDPYPPPRSHPYSRDPYYDYYDRRYAAERLPPAPRYPDDRLLAYDREDRLPPPRDPYDRYPPPRYPLRDPYPAYDRYPPPPRPSADPYERPPPDYYSRYRAYDGYDDPPRRPAAETAPPLPPPRAANGYDDRRPEPDPGAVTTDSFSSSYTSYYDRFYSKVGGANGADPSRALPPARPAGRGALAPATRSDQQAALQTGPIYF